MALSHTVEHVQALQNPMKATLGEHTAVLKYIPDAEINKLFNFYDHLAQYCLWVWLNSETAQH